MATLQLEDFGSPFASMPQSGDEAPLMTAAEVEADRLAAFDQGYAAGWEDATKAGHDDADRMKSDFAKTLRDMGFTFHEARAHVMRGLVPLLKAVTETLLPCLVQQTLGARLEQEIRALAEGATDVPILLRAAPGEAEPMRECLAEVTGLPVDLAEDDSVPPGQLFLILGQSEVNIDLAGPTARLAEALEALETDMKEQLNA